MIDIKADVRSGKTRKLTANCIQLWKYERVCSNMSMTIASGAKLTATANPTFATITVIAQAAMNPPPIIRINIPRKMFRMDFPILNRERSRRNS
ncbi:hypothetical protein Brsp01_31840 [Brucella sp. NBRC 12950]|nr:hypothetical protein Brsp01_31840 [Brucella sp. NBRC 12950]